MITGLQISAEHRDMLEEIISKADLILPTGYTMSLFGSRARNEARDNSDWDIHIVVPGADRIPISRINDWAFPLQEIGWQYNQQVTIFIYSQADWERRHYLPFYKNVEHDKVSLNN